MALRNYMLNLLSGCAETTDTSVTKMHVTIVNDNSVPLLFPQRDATACFPISCVTSTNQTHLNNDDSEQQQQQQHRNDEEAHTTPRPHLVRTVSQASPMGSRSHSPSIHHHFQNHQGHERKRKTLRPGPTLCRETLSPSRGINCFPNLFLD